MRKLVLLIVLASLAAADGNVTRFLTVTTSTSCPGNLLTMTATASDGTPGPDVELRLVLQEPYQGLRALEHTDENGIAQVQLTKPGTYRIYIISHVYNYDEYTEFNYSSMCPPPPPKRMNLTISPLCNESRLLIATASGNGTPLDSVYLSIRNKLNWSTFTTATGEASFPLEEGDIFINATRSDYAPESFYYTVNCTPTVPPECTDNSGCADNQFCSGEKCVNISGRCGYPANHSWYAYRCCSDADCDNSSICENNSCAPKLPEAAVQNNTNQTSTQAAGRNTCPIGLFAFFLIAAIYFVRKN